MISLRSSGADWNRGRRQSGREPKGGGMGAEAASMGQGGGNGLAKEEKKRCKKVKFYIFKGQKEEKIRSIRCSVEN